MIGSFSFRRLFSLLALGLMTLAGPVSVAQAQECEPFRARGTFTITDEGGTHSGRAKPGGAFTGTIDAKQRANGQRETGTVVYDFGDGNTLVTEVDLRRDSQDPSLLVGTFVITGGTGEYEGATGGGTQVVNTADGTFELDGEVCR